MFPEMSSGPHRALRLSGLAGLTLAASAGCAVPPPETDPGGEIQAAVGLDEAVVFHAEPGLLDERAAGAELSEATAVRYAVVTSAELQAALARVEVAARAADIAGQLPNPVLSLVLRQPSGSLSTQVFASLTEDLVGILQRPERATIAGHRLEAEAAAALATALDVVTEVQTAYAECQALEELVSALERRSALFDRLLEVASQRRELGLTSRHDLDSIESQRTELSIEVARRRQELRLARLALARRIGEPSGAADWKLDPWAAPPAVAIDEPCWLEEALSSRPEVAALEWELRARQEEESLASGLPWDGASVGVEADTADEGEPDDEGWEAGPRVETPLAIFDTPEERREQARGHTAEVRHLLTAARRAVVEDVRSALATLESAQESLLRVEAELIPLQERRQAEIEEVYQAGAIDLTAVLMAQEALGRAQEMRLELEREVSTAQFRLQRAVGGPVHFRWLSPPAPAPVAIDAPPPR
jgi:outer membrane protein TolC